MASDCHRNSPQNFFVGKGERGDTPDASRSLCSWELVWAPPATPDGELIIYATAGGGSSEIRSTGSARSSRWTCHEHGGSAYRRRRPRRRPRDHGRARLARRTAVGAGGAHHPPG